MDSVSYLNPFDPASFDHHTGLTPRLPTGLTPQPWMNGLTPSVFGHKEHSNPFDASFLEGSAIGKRKRALSSPAITPGFGLGAGAFDYFSETSGTAGKALTIDTNLDGMGHASPKKRRYSWHENASLDDDPPASASAHDSNSDSPASSVVVTPVDVPSYHDILTSTYSPPPSTLSYAVPATTAPFHNYTAAPSATTAHPLAIAPSSSSAPTSDMNSNHSPVPSLAELERQRRGYASRQGVPGQLSAAANPSASSVSSTQNKASSTAQEKKGENKAKPAGAPVVKQEENQPVDDDDEEEARRKDMLERNRIAACKSRRKKKERVALLESQANDLCNRNIALQHSALALKAELAQFRQMLALHNTCSCTHVAGYLQREANGGGIPTIDALAGHTMAVDYGRVPKMGTYEDVYEAVEVPGIEYETTTKAKKGAKPPAKMVPVRSGRVRA